jgi:voltage-gated potassium channel
MTIFLIAQKLFNRVRDVHVAILLSVAIGIVIVGGILFSAADGVSVGTGLYWSVTTATTVGYGDVTPANVASRVIAVCVMLTTIPLVGACFALFAGASAVSHLRRMLGLDTHLPASPYTVIYGAHPVLAHVLAELALVDDTVVLVASAKPPHLQADVHYVTGDPTDEEAIRASRPDQADRALIACASDADTLIVAVALRTSAPDLEIYALSESARVASALRDLGVTHTLSSTELVGHTVAKSLETPSAGNVVLQLVDSSAYSLRERDVEPELVSRTLSQARAVAGALVLGISRDGKVDLGVGDDPVLVAGDRLVELIPCPEGRRAK